MKPIHLNLASRPYRDYRPLYVVVAALSLLTAFLLITNVTTYFRYTEETKSTREKIAQIEAQTQRERERASSVQHRLSRIDLKTLDAQTRYINARLYERTFSWSALLDKLESVLGNDVRLVSVSPVFSPTGPVALALQLQSKSPDGMIETINRMNADPQFQGAFPSSESVIEGGYQFGLNVDYMPASRNGVEEVR